jgi:hypothetical protein
MVYRDVAKGERLVRVGRSQDIKDKLEELPIPELVISGDSCLVGEIFAWKSSCNEYNIPGQSG